MPADYLSRNLISAILWNSEELLQAQAADPLIKALKGFLLNQELPRDPKCQALVKLLLTIASSRMAWCGAELSDSLSQAEWCSFCPQPWSLKRCLKPMESFSLGTMESTKLRSASSNAFIGQAWMQTLQLI